MELKDTVKAFKAHQKKMHAFEHATALLNYDAATTMPPGASETSGDTLAVLSAEIYRDDSRPIVQEMLCQLNELERRAGFSDTAEAEELLEQMEKMEKVPEGSCPSKSRSRRTSSVLLENRQEKQ